MLMRGLDKEMDKEKDKEKRERMETWVNIVYTGTIYQGKQDPAKLFQAVAELIRDGQVEREAISVDFYGGVLGWLEKDIKKYGLVGVAIQHGVVSQEEAIQKQRDARILWLMKWESITKGIGRFEMILERIFSGKEGLRYSREFNEKFAGKPEQGVVPLKLFEYLAARRPIMATGGHKDEVNKILDDSKMGACCETVEEIKDFIRGIY